MFIVMALPGMSFGGWLLMAGLTLVAIWICRQDLREMATLRPMATRFACAVTLAVVCAVGLSAQPVYVNCDWDQLLEMCGGYTACAWAAWWMNACPWMT
jgi:hypothetical protein